MALLATLPLQLVCQLIVPEITGLNETNYAEVNQAPIHFQPKILSSGATAVKLASLPLQLVCELLVTSNPGIDETGDLVDVVKSRVQVIPEGYKTFPDDHAAYKIYREHATWYDARERCILDDGHLAIPDSREKIQHINSLRKSSDKWLHVGVYRTNITDEWVRVDDDKPAKYLLWKEEHPDSNGDCTGLAIVGEGIINYECHKSEEYYVCEIPIKKEL